jgi:hypothetical protein
VYLLSYETTANGVVYGNLLLRLTLGLGRRAVFFLQIEDGLGELWHLLGWWRLGRRGGGRFRLIRHLG